MKPTFAHFLYKMEYTIMTYAYLCGSWQSPIHEDELQQLYRTEVIASVFNSTL